VRNFIGKAGKSKIMPPPDWLEDQVQTQKMFCVSKDSPQKIMASEIPHQTVPLFVFISWSEKKTGTSVRDVMWVCVCVVPCFVE